MNTHGHISGTAVMDCGQLLVKVALTSLRVTLETNCLQGENSQGRDFAFGRRDGENGRGRHRNNLNLETEAVWKP